MQKSKNFFSNNSINSGGKDISSVWAALNLRNVPPFRTYVKMDYSSEYGDPQGVPYTVIIVPAVGTPRNNNTVLLFQLFNHYGPFFDDFVLKTMPYEHSIRILHKFLCFFVLLLLTR